MPPTHSHFQAATAMHGQKTLGVRRTEWRLVRTILQGWQFPHALSVRERLKVPSIVAAMPNCIGLAEHSAGFSRGYCGGYVRLHGARWNIRLAFFPA